MKLSIELKENNECTGPQHIQYDIGKLRDNPGELQEEQYDEQTNRILNHNGTLGELGAARRNGGKAQVKQRDANTWKQLVDELNTVRQQEFPIRTEQENNQDKQSKKRKH